MSGISTKGMYGLAAMYFLEQSDASGPVQISAIASGANIPQNYLEQILLELRKSGLLESIRGAKGGYTITQKGKDSTVLEIIYALEGEMCKLDCRTQNNVLAAFWGDVSQKIKDVFDIKLKELKNVELKLTDSFNYSI
ncbi:MAG TPA: Rrf2 family transcriptional regulator [Campylobacterales bacterium]|nr:Rrf2 family transcriptional regulator [Campylobacterales bacterium]